MAHWQNRTMHNGQYSLISDLIKAGSHNVAICGNSAEGWHVVLYSVAMPNVTLDVSPVFAREFGDTMRDLQAACNRVYGVVPRKYKLA